MSENKKSEEVDEIKLNETDSGKKTYSSRYWCFTHWLDHMDYKKFIEKLPDCGYLVYQQEKCPKTSKIHIQGYVEFKRNKTLKTLKKICKFTHWGGRKGSAEQAAHYCKKPVLNCSCKHCIKEHSFRSSIEGTLIEEGELSKQGKRNDINDLKECLKNKGEEAAYEDHFGTMLRCYKGAQRYLELINENKAQEIRNIINNVLIGKAGRGKSQFAESIEDKKEIYSSPITDDKIWFQNYKGQKVLIIEDFDGSQIRFRNLLRILDKYKLQVPTKGGFVWAQWTKVYITSNKMIEDWYPNVSDIQPLIRRINKVLLCKRTKGKYYTEEYKIHEQNIDSDDEEGKIPEVKRNKTKTNRINGTSGSGDGDLM